MKFRIIKSVYSLPRGVTWEGKVFEALKEKKPHDNFLSITNKELLDKGIDLGFSDIESIEEYPPLFCVSSGDVWEEVGEAS